MPRKPVPLTLSSGKSYSDNSRATDGKMRGNCERSAWCLTSDFWPASVAGFSGRVGCEVGDASADFALDADAELDSSFGASKLEMSSPSSASSAMTFPTGIFFAPS